MKYDRRLLEKAVETYPKVTGRNFILASKLSPKQISNAIKHIDKNVKPEDVVAFLDSTLFSSGKGGILLTTEKITSSDSVTSAAYFESFIKAEYSAEELKVYYASGAFRRIKIKTYAVEAASLLNTIVKLREETAKIEPKKAEPAKTVVPARTEPPKSVLIKTEPAKPAVSVKTEPQSAEPKEGTYAWYFRKALAGDVTSMLKIAEICEEAGEYNHEEKLHEALFWNLRAAEEGNTTGAGNVGRFLEEGIGMPINNKEALKWYKKSPSNTGDYELLKTNIEIGVVDAVPDEDEYEEFVQWAGDFGEISFEDGISFAERLHGYMLIYISAMLGYPDAQFMLGKIYSEDSKAGKADHIKENYWILEAYKKGNDAAATYAAEHNFFLKREFGETVE